MKKKTIPIVFSANDNYIPYLGVTIESIIENSSDCCQYEIYVLSSGLSTFHSSSITNMRNSNVNINIIDVAEMMKEKNISMDKIRCCKHLSIEASFRLVIDKIFTQYSKLIYLDCDTVVMRDLSELYDIDIADNVLGACRGCIPLFLYNYLKNETDLSMRDYFNSGVLLINVEKYRQLNIGDRCFELLESGKKFVTFDQDVLNIVCRGHIGFLPGAWNVEWQFFSQPHNKNMVHEEREDILKLSQNPYIIHYTSSTKPWNNPDIFLAEHFWRYARETVFYEEILFRNFIGKERKRESNVFDQYVFPWKMVLPDSNIIIYGNGKVGKAFVRQLELTQYCHIKGICDKAYSDNYDGYIPYVTLKELKNINVDFIVVSVLKKEMADEIIEELNAIGISKKQIIWSKYKRN